MKKIIALVAAVAVVASFSVALAKKSGESQARGVATVAAAATPVSPGSNGQPFMALWAAIDDIRNLLTNHTHGTSTTPGPTGPQGPAGDDGISCWDLNGNGIGDVATEDKNGDGAVNVLDCQGTGGTQGSAGPAGPTGPQGPAGIMGAGNIAFLDTEATGTSTITLYALTTDSHVWERGTSTWMDLNRTVPTSTSSILQWELTSFLDDMGNIWMWNGAAWANVSHP